MDEQLPIELTSKVRILYVEDDFDSRELIKFLLKRENENYDVTVVATFAEAVEQISESPFDLYILDYCLPSKSGIYLCYFIRETDLRTPILFYSAIGRHDDQKSALKAGANDYLVKPADIGMLTKRVNQLLFESAPTN